MGNGRQYGKTVPALGRLISLLYVRVAYTSRTVFVLARSRCGQMGRWTLKLYLMPYSQFRLHTKLCNHSDLISSVHVCPVILHMLDEWMKS